MYWRSSHIPFTFFRKQMDLPAPPRFVKFISRASSPTQGLFRTVPTSDHVPELMNAQSSPLAGIAAIADAVSWHAGTISLVPPNAVSFARSPPMLPTIEPVGTILGAAEISSPSDSNISSHHSCPPKRTSWVCVALVYSATRCPPSR